MVEIAKQHLLVGEGLVELELIDKSAVESGLDEPVVLHALLVLLPLEVQEGGGAVI
jgi:hypothetical protein